jgi:hypothetical protein
MRILDFSDGFTSSTQPTVGSVPASGIAVTPTGNITSTDVQSALVEVQTHVDTINAQKAAINGLASLDASGHVPVSQMPAAALGALSYKGALDASVGTYPASPAKGDYYVVNVVGTISTVAYKIGDWATYDGTSWDKVDNGQSITSVSGRTGVIVLTATDVGLANVTNTSDATKNSAVATLTNKTLNTPIIDVMSVTDQGSVPSTPAAGTHKLYSKAAGMFILDSTGVEKPVGSGSGGGSKNYLSTYNGNTGNGDFELNNTNGWSLFHTTLTGTLPTGSITSGATSWTTFGIASGTSLAGSHSMTAGGSSGLTAGEGFISDAFTIDLEDKARVQTIAFSYSPVYGTLDFSGTSSNTFAVYVYDVTNSVWIQPAGCYGMTQGSGVGEVTATFQTSSNSTQYRLAIVCINACSGLTDLLFDSFSVGPQAKVLGAAITDWQPYTPVITGFGTPSAVDAAWRQVGDTYQIKGNFTAGSSTAVEGRWSLPNSAVSKDSTIIPSTQICGSGATTVGGAFDIVVLMQASVGYVTFGRSESTAASAYPRNANTLINLGEAISFYASVPIAGKSSNVQVSSDTDTRVVVASYKLSADTAVSANSIVPFNTQLKDSHAMVSSGLITIAVSGEYRFSLTTQASASTNVYIKKNGTAAGYLFTTQNGYVGSGGNSLPFNAGDTLGFYIDNAATLYAGSTNGPITQFSIERVTGPATVAANEKIFASYSASGSISWTATGGGNFDVKNEDSHGAVTTGSNAWKFTAPTSDQYRVGITITVTSSSQAWAVFKNGLLYKYLFRMVSASGQIQSGFADVHLNAGEYFDVRLDSGTCGGDSSPNANNIYVTRVGN